MTNERINREFRWHEQFPNFQPFGILQLAIHRKNRVGPVNTFCAGTLEPERDKIRRKGTKREKRKKKEWNRNVKEKKKKETGIRSILRVVVHLCYFNIREWPHYRILSANICALLGPRLFYVQNIFSSKVEKERERGKHRR